MQEVDKILKIELSHTAPIKFSHKRGHRKIVVCKSQHDRITSHTCRRSFCTHEFLACSLVELIIKISGQNSLKGFYKYIKISPEVAAEKIKDVAQEG